MEDTRELIENMYIQNCNRAKESQRFVMDTCVPECKEGEGKTKVDMWKGEVSY